MIRILITGANSYVGTSFADYLAQLEFAGMYQVDTLDMVGDVWRSCDFSGYDVVYHVAGIAHSDNGKISEERAKLYYAVNTNLTVECAKRAKEAGVRQFIFMSSAIVYGDSKVQAENGLRPLDCDSFKVVILRPPMIFGKGSKGNYPLLSKLARKLPIFPKVKNCRSMLYVGNLVEFVRLMVENGEQGTFWPQNPQYSNTSEVIATIAKAHGKRCVLIPGLGWALKLLALATGLVNKAFGNLAYDQAMSVYKDPYQKFSLQEAIERTER